MPYNINYTDKENKPPITVFDNTSNTDTSLIFPGRNVTGYGQVVGENFLALLENFSSSTAPINPTEGQLWYNSDPNILSLFVYDGVDWKSASGIQKSPIAPATDQAKVGELWVDTINQQLYVFSGTDWILVGPNFSTGLRSGLQVEQILDSNDVNRIVSIVYVEDRPIIIISKDSFTPKLLIPQFPSIRAGITLAQPNPSITSETDVYIGGFIPKLFGSSTAADGLNVGERIVESSKFLRSDIVNVVENAFNVKSDSGITFGVDGTFNISTSVTSTRLYNNTPGSSIDLQLNNSGIPSTIVRVIDNKVGINTLAPTELLDVNGNVKLSGNLIITNQERSTNINNGAVRIDGGVTIKGNLLIQEGIDAGGTSSRFTTIIPRTTDAHDLGSSIFRWREVRTKILIADEIKGVLTGNIDGVATRAIRLENSRRFSIVGDITSTNSISFNGINDVEFQTRISPQFISNATPIPTLTAPNRPFSLKDDIVLIQRPSFSGLLSASRDTFVGDLGLPMGSILPFAGQNVPFGFLLCDGSEVLISQYFDLFQVIGTIYNGPAPLQGVGTFRLPDLRGRFALGRDNMDNGLQVSAGGQNFDAGGGNVDRVGGVEPDTLGGAGGNSQYNLSVANLPEHEHSMRGSTGQRYFAVRSDSTAPLDSGAFLGIGGTTPNRLQYLPSSGGIISATTNQPYAVINPFLTINYIIRAGAPAF